jgi:dienelactone hydrolase
MPADARPQPGDVYPIVELDLNAARLGMPVAQLPPAKGLFGMIFAGARDLHVQFIYPSGPDPSGEPVGPMPVLVYFPGWPGDRRDNLGLLRDLASHGYFIAEVTYVREDRRLRGEMDFSTEAAAVNTLRMARTKVALQAQDATSVLDALQRLSAHDPGRLDLPRLDLDRAAIFGYSFGGAVAAEACAHDPRFRAALNIDGWLFGDGAKLAFDQPYFLMSDDDPDPTAAQLASPDSATRNQSILTDHDLHTMRERLGRPGGIMMTILATQHESFSDTPAHPAATARVSSIIRAYARAFFDKTLKARSPPLLTSTASPYGEVRLSIAM